MQTTSNLAKEMSGKLKLERHLSIARSGLLPVAQEERPSAALAEALWPSWEVNRSAA